MPMIDRHSSLLRLLINYLVVVVVILRRLYTSQGYIFERKMESSDGHMSKRLRNHSGTGVRAGGRVSKASSVSYVHRKQCENWI